MGGVLDWSTTPGSNTTVDGVNIAEGMQAGLVNNGMRAIMALVREWQLDASGVVTAGAGNAYTITSNQGIAAYADGLRFSFRADRNNTGAATLNVDGHGAKALRKTAAGALAALAADDLVAEAVYDVVYDASSDVFVIVGTHGVAGLTAFGQSLISAADAAAGRTVLSLGTVATESIVPLAKGGTGVALVDPNADRILFWDDSAGAVAFLVAGAGLTISGTTITAQDTFGTAQDISSGAGPFSFAIPTNATMIELIAAGASLSGAGEFLVQLSTSAAYVTSGYTSYSSVSGNGSTSTAGMIVRGSAAANSWRGTMRLRKVEGNRWVSVHDGSLNTGSDDHVAGSGEITLAGAIDGIRLAATAGNFDGVSGRVNVIHNGT